MVHGSSVSGMHFDATTGFWQQRRACIQNGGGVTSKQKMSFDLEQYMESERLPEVQRRLLREQATHSVSCYGLNGEHIRTPFDKEDLLAVLLNMERYLIDSNSAWENEPIKPKNRNKAFILGATIADEKENLEGLLFNPKIGISNNNIFGFLMNNVTGIPFLMIERFDTHFRKIFDKAALREESRPRAKRTGVEYQQAEKRQLDDILDLKHRILAILNTSDIMQLPPAHKTEEMKTNIMSAIRSIAPHCFTNYDNAVKVATLCYAALLLERDDDSQRIGSKTRAEFNDPHNRNVFGDTRLIQNALWLNSRILSNDKAVRRMAGYIELPNVKVVGCL